jgi:hypothetical protein
MLRSCPSSANLSRVAYFYGTMHLDVVTLSTLITYLVSNVILYCPDELRLLCIYPANHSYICIQSPCGTIVGDENLQLYISKYYKKLFGEPTPSTLTLNEDYIQDILQLTQDEMISLLLNSQRRKLRMLLFKWS